MIRRHGLTEFVQILGRPCCLLYSTLDQDGRPSQAFRTLFLQETIRRGVLMPSLVVSYSHTDEHIDITVAAIDEALAVYRRALDDGVDRYLVGRPSQALDPRPRQSEEPGQARRERVRCDGPGDSTADPWEQISA